jgi:hypothetical protein
MEQPIYEIHVMEQPYFLDKDNFPSCDMKERVGFYYEEKTAVRAVEENWCSIQDHYARAAEIREVEPGLYPIKNEIIHYYLWDTNEHKFKEAPIPHFNGFIL